MDNLHYGTLHLRGDDLQNIARLQTTGIATQAPTGDI